MEDLNSSTEVVEGIGPALAAILREADILSVADLLRVGPVAVHRALNGTRSPQTAQSWCRMASLLQVDQVNPRRARTLAAGGLSSPQDIGIRDLDELQALLGDGADRPTAAELYTMAKDAVLIANRGCIAGTVIDTDSRPLPGATVTTGAQETTTDPRGRFRLIRVAWWSETSVQVRHPNHPPAQFAVPRLFREDARYSRTYRLAAPGSTEPFPVAELMEVRGDVLPLMGDARPAARQVNPEAFIRRDILSVVEWSEDGKRVKLASKLLTWVDGRFEVRWAWFPASDFVGAHAGDSFVVGVDGLRPIALDARRLRTWVGMLRARKLAGTRPDDPDDLGAWLDRVSAVMRDPTISGDRRF